MKKGEDVIGVIEKVAYPNVATVIAEDEKIKTKGGVPGQTVSVRLTKRRSGHFEGNIKEVITPAANEIQPKCPHAENCGGCSYQTLSYEDQLALKEKQVRELFTNAGLDINLQGLLASPCVSGYRNKMEFTFGDEVKGGELTLGLHKKGNFYDIMTTDGCEIAHPDFGLILKTVLDYAHEKGYTHFHKMTHVGYMRHLLIRRGYKTGEILVNIVTTREANDDFKELCDRLLALPVEGTYAGIMHGYNDDFADCVKCDSMDILYGRDYFYEELLGLKFKVSVFSFFQTNSSGAEVLYRNVCDMITGCEDGLKDMTVFDLYSGTGTIAQLVASSAKKVIGVEIIEEAVEAAKENRNLNGLDNCDFIAGDVFKVLDDIKEMPDFIILDPPREGVLPKALTKILAYDVKNIIYISCKATSLVRDLPIFIENGYKPVKSVCVDMFPYTTHVETVVLMSRKDK